MMDWEKGEVIRRQGLFCTALVRQFMKKICKYQNLMLKHNVNITDSGYGSSVHTSRSFDDDIELVLKENSSAVDSCKSFWNLGARLSVLKFFQWVSKIVQRTKAARILCHIDAIAESEIESTIVEVARELSVAFEYQILMLYGDSEVIKLADHAASCLTTYLNSCDSAFTCSNLLQAILEVKPLTGNKKDVVRTKVVPFNGNSVCLHWKLWQIFKQPGLRILADSLETKLEEKTATGSDTACSTQTGNKDTNNLECVVTVEEPNISFVSVETKTKNPQQELDERTRCDILEKLRDEENKQPCLGTVFGKSIRDFEQEINGDITSVEEEMFNTLSESYSSEDAIAQETNDNRNTATNENTSDSIQETLEKENVLSQKRGDKLTLQNKFTENILRTNEIHNVIQPADDSESAVATADTLGIFREVINETDRYNENVLEKAVPVATDEVCNSGEENVGTFKERDGMEDILSRMETSESLQKKITTHDAVVIEDNQGSEQRTKSDDDKVVVEFKEVIRDKELDFIKGQDISIVFETSEVSTSIDRDSDCEVDTEHVEFHSAATSGPAEEFGVNYDIYNDSIQEMVNDSHILSVTVQAGDKAKKIVHNTTNNYTIDTSNCHNVTSKYVIQGEDEDSFNINNCLLEDGVPGTSVVYEHDTQWTNISKKLSNQVSVTPVIEEVKENALASENPNLISPRRNQIMIFRGKDFLFETQTNYIPESQLDQVTGDHVIEDIEQNAPMHPCAVSKQDTQINYIPESQLDQVIGDHVLEDIAENVPMPPRSAIPKQDTQTNYIPESQLDHVTGDHVIEDIEQNAPMHPCAVSKQDTQINYIPESQLDQVIGDHVLEDIAENVPMPPRSAIPKQDTQTNYIPESQLDHVIGDHVIEDTEQNVSMTGSSAIPKQDTQINYIPESHSDQVIRDHVIEDIEENVPMSPSSAIPKQDTHTNHIPESQLDHVIGDHVIGDIEQNMPVPGYVFANSAVSENVTEMNITETQSGPVIFASAMKDMEQNVPIPGHISNNSPISKPDTKMIISESQLNHVIPDHAVEDIEQNIAYRFYGCFTPYGAKCRPNIYGFRGPLHIWNEEEGKYTLVYNDRVTVVNCRARQIPFTEGNIHQAYIPKSFCKH